MVNLLFENIGKIFSVKDAIAQVAGLLTVTSGEMVSDIHGFFGLALNLESGWTGVVMFQDNVLMAGDFLSRTYSILSVIVDFTMQGFPLSPLGFILIAVTIFLGFSILNVSYYFGVFFRGVELKAPGIIEREPVHESASTGIAGIDAVFPLGLGQRELIIGDRQTGKTTLAIDSFISQSSIGIYVLRLFLRSFVMKGDNVRWK